MKRAALLLCGLVAAGCPPPAQERPGTPSNSVSKCTEAGQVCKTGDAPLGVCVTAKSNCTDPDGCFKCAPQH